jgi:carboxymethylenebutenolidase
MCDERTNQENNEFLDSIGQLTRRQFGKLSAGAGLAMMLPKVANAVEVMEMEVNITTPDGTADCYFVHPTSGEHPSVLMWPDIFGLRPAFKQMGKRLAESGYSVLVVNPFYRTQKAPTSPENSDFNNPDTRAALLALAGTLTAETTVADAKAFIAWLDAQAPVDKNRKMGTMGYCMSGSFTMRTAAALPDRVGAGASFHGGSLVTDKPDSPHLLVPQMKAHYLVAIAENDDKNDPKAKDVLRETFAQANLPAEIEVYAGAMHGWCPPDSRVYNEAQAERAWSRLLALFERALA